jgi:hypothetical protein
LKAQGYGGINDWDIIAHAEFSEREATESALRKALKSHVVRGRSYTRTAVTQEATELYSVSYLTVRPVFLRMVDEHSGQNFTE